MDIKNLYSQLTNRLSSYDLLSVINGTLDVLYDTDVRDGLYSFWHCITLMRWAIIHCTSSDLIILKNINRRELLSILMVVAKLEDLYNLQELEKEDVDIYVQLQAIQNQQMPLQKGIDKFTFSRQSLLYNKIGFQKSKLNEQIESISTLNLEELIASLFFLHVIIYPEIYKVSSPYNGRIDPIFLNTIDQLYGSEKLDSLMKLITLDTRNINELKNEMKSITSLKNPILFLYDVNVITQKPVIKISNQYRVIHRNLLNLTSRYLIYDSLKRKYKDQFTTEFGRRIEKYVQIGLDELNLNYKTEKQLIKEYSQIESVVDYLIEDKVLIECKGVELHPMPRVMPTSRNLTNYLKGSLIKAIRKQFTSFLNTTKLKKNDCYALIITYKELHLGFGKDIIDRILSDEKDQVSVKQFLDSERVFVLELEEWDILLSTLKREKLTLVQLLDKVREEEQKNRKAYISMHLHEIYGENRTKLDYLDNEYENMMNRIQEQFK